MPQLLLEIFSEEIPARMQQGAARDLERMATERLKAAGLTWEALTTFGGPRRLTLVVEGLPAATADVEEELKGPRASAPPQALEGFLRKNGLTREQLEERDGVLFAVIRRQGQSTAAMIPEMVDQIIRAFPWPKSMRWGDGTLRWVRPIKRILCLFDGAVVPFEVDGVQSDALTEGHRFMGSGQVLRVSDFADYRRQLEKNFVLLDVVDRKLRILEQAKAACAARGLALVDDDGLLDEVAGLAEWPTPIVGDMDPQFLSLPPEVIRLSMKTHQKYFAVRQSPPAGGSTREAGEGGVSAHALAPNFVVVANVEAADGGQALAAGNSRVLSARLNDARFFWDEDQKVGFDAWLKKLEGVTFHAKLGTMAERVERIAALARDIAPLVGADPNKAAEAARLAKADLASGMVGEFPELQGIMGGYYARALLPSPLMGEGSGLGVTSVQDEVSVGATSSGGVTPTQPSPIKGEGFEIADAIRDHYKPQGPADTVPTAPLTVAVALADKLDTLVGFFAIDEKPTGSKDPYALRRATLGLSRIILTSGIRVPLLDLIFAADGPFREAHREVASDQIAYADLVSDLMHRGFGSRATRNIERIMIAGADTALGAYLVRIQTSPLVVLDFVFDRLKVLLRDQGKRHDLVDAVFALGDDDLVRIVRRVEALDAFLATDDGANLLAGYKRASNILRAEAKKGDLPTGMVQTGLPGQPEAETALAFAVAAADGQVATAVEVEDYAAAMTALAALRAPVDAFFEGVMVNSDVAAERDNRLKLLGQVRDVTNRVADFGLIGG